MPRTSAFFLAASIVGLAPLLLLAQTNGNPMTHEKKDASFYVAGYLVRTNNADEMNGKSRIGPLWGRFMQENLAGKIPHRTDAGFTIVYSNYASDEKGDYDYLLGARVSSIDHLPAGLSWRKVEPGPYAVILTDKGAMPGVLQAAWAQIWKMKPADLGGKRAFATDYEVYDQRSADPQAAQVEIHIGLVPESR
jgi:predicted transcriptional regulator YdeE